jgi:hypothetical protein
MRIYDRWMVFGQKNETPEVWLWCLHCERAYQLKDCRRIENFPFPGEYLEMCHYPDCDGDTVMDAWRWGSVSGSDALAIPEMGKVYPMYGKPK